MIGKSYDGTVANGVAATGSRGWRRSCRSRRSAPGTTTTATRGSRSATTTRPACPVRRGEPHRAGRLRRRHRTGWPPSDGDETGAYNEFWARRDYRRPDADAARSTRQRVRRARRCRTPTSRPATSPSGGRSSATRACTRKMWLTRLGHVDPFDFDRARVGGHPAPLVRQLAAGHRQRDPRRAAGRRRGARRASG